MKRRTSASIAAAKAAVFVLAEIKSVTEAFDRGEINALDAVHAIAAATDACRNARRSPRHAA